MRVGRAEVGGGTPGREELAEAGPSGAPRTGSRMACAITTNVIQPSVRHWPPPPQLWSKTGYSTSVKFLSAVSSLIGVTGIIWIP